MTAAYSGLVLRTKVTTKNEATIEQMSNPNVSMLFFQTYWKDLEPSYRSTNYKQLDLALKAAVNLKKPIKISLVAGDHSPSWLASMGVPFLQFFCFRGFGSTDHFYDPLLPIVWNPTFLSEFKWMVQDLAAHLKADPSVMNLLKMVEITGINESTPEIRLTAQTPVTKNGLTSSNAPEIWKDNGYLPQKVEGAWAEILAIYENAFPNVYLDMVIIPKRAFPLINTEGNFFTWKSTDDELTLSLIQIAALKLGKRLIIKDDSLDDQSSPVDLLVRAKALGQPIAFQLKEKEYSLAPCVSTKTCDQGTLSLAIKLAKQQDGSFLEIFPETVDAFSSRLSEW